MKCVPPYKQKKTKKKPNPQIKVAQKTYGKSNKEKTIAKRNKERDKHQE
jgi:hypothetical protein